MRKLYILLYSVLLLNTSLFSSLILYNETNSESIYTHQSTSYSYCIGSMPTKENTSFSSTTSDIGSCVLNQYVNSHFVQRGNYNSDYIVEECYSVGSVPYVGNDVWEFKWSASSGNYCKYECNVGYIENPDGSNSCILDPETDPEYIPPDNGGTPNKCDPEHPDFNSYDCDGDGTLNELDSTPTGEIQGDTNGDGVVDTNDKPLGVTGSTCEGLDYDTRVNFGIDFGNINNYAYFGVTYGSQCDEKHNESNIDGSARYVDLSTACEDEYCYIHYITKDCNFDANVYKPIGSNWFLDTKYDTAFECQDGFVPEHQLNFSFTQPDASNCPNVGFCFYQDKNDIVYEPSATDTNTSDPNPTSTTAELEPLVESQNNTNIHLKDLKKKIDNSNIKLDTINSSIKNLDTTSKSTLSALKSMGTEDKNYHINSISALKDIDNSVKNLEKTLESGNFNINNSLNAINENLINGNTMTTDPFSDPGIFDDGLSESLGGFETDVKGGFSGFVHNNLLGFANQSYVLPTITISMMGTTFTAFEPAMFASFPVNDVRSIILFIFSIAGFISVFKGGS